MTRISALAGLVGSWIAISGASMSASMLAAAEPKESPAPDKCKLTLGPKRTVTRIIDGETVAMNDGTEVRLIGALSPRARDARADRGTWTPENQTRQMLETMLLGQTVQLAYGETPKDRYGRHIAHLFLNSPGERRWVQADLVEGGFARAYALPRSGSCLAGLVGRERRARDLNIGLWSELIYRPISAERTGLLMSRRSTLQVVRGRVTAVSTSKSATFLNFGEDWRADFTVRISKQLADKFPDWSRSLPTLKGREIEVRGWIARANGPMVDLSDPAELVQTGDVALTSDFREGIGGDRAPNSDLPLLEPEKPTTGNETRPDAERPGALDL